MTPAPPSGWLFAAALATLVGRCSVAVPSRSATTWPASTPPTATCGSSAASTGVIGVDPRRRAELARLPALACSPSRSSACSSSTCCSALQEVLPYSLGLPAAERAARVQHGDLVRDQHELAVVLPRHHARLHRAARRARGAELRVRGGRHRRRDRPGARARRAPHRHDRQLLGGPHPRHPAHPAAALGRRRDRADRRRRHPELRRIPDTCTTLTGGTATIPGGPVASQEAIKELGTNGGGFFNANSAHPFENPTAWTNLFEIFLMLVIPFSLPRTFGKMVGDSRQGVRDRSATMAIVLRRIGRRC